MNQSLAAFSEQINVSLLTAYTITGKLKTQSPQITLDTVVPDWLCSSLDLTVAEIYSISLACHQSMSKGTLKFPDYINLISTGKTVQ